MHVTNTWSNLAFWYKEHPNKNMLYFGIETGTPKSKYMFCKILHSQLNQSSWKGQSFFQKDCCNTSRNNLDCNIYISQKGIVFYFKQSCISQLKQASWKRHVLFKRSKKNAATLQGVLCFVIKKFVPKKASKMNVVSNWKRHLEKGMCFSKVMLQDFKGYYNLSHISQKECSVGFFFNISKTRCL